MFINKEEKLILNELQVLQEYCGFDIRKDPEICVFFLQQSAKWGMNMRHYCEEVAGAEINALR